MQFIPYEVGHRAACAGEPRQVPGTLNEVETQAWLIGYEDAESDNETERAAMLASFSE